MSQLLAKSLRISIWVLLPLLFTSYISPSFNNATPSIIDGVYKLKTTGNQPMDLTGSIFFTTAVELSGKGKSFSTLKLELHNNEFTKEHSLGFLICKQNYSQELKKGTYKVPGKIDGFLKNFDGVFGFANIHEMGELPFFAENGKITISNIDAEVLYGTIEVRLENSEGKQLNIKGNFTAARKKIK